MRQECCISFYPVVRAGGEVHLLHRLLQVATAGSRFEDILNVLGLAGRQGVFSGHDAFAGLVFEFEAGALGNLAAGLCGRFVFREVGSSVGFGNLAGGKLGEDGEDELGLAHVVVQVLGFKPF